jgi:hypothetical protein
MLTSMKEAIVNCPLHELHTEDVKVDTHLYRQSGLSHTTVPKNRNLVYHPLSGLHEPNQTSAQLPVNKGTYHDETVILLRGSLAITKVYRVRGDSIRGAVYCVLFICSRKRIYTRYLEGNTGSRGKCEARARARCRCSFA